MDNKVKKFNIQFTESVFASRLSIDNLSLISAECYMQRM